jgi:hypothetical protein
MVAAILKSSSVEDLREALDFVQKKRNGSSPSVRVHLDREERDIKYELERRESQSHGA